MPIYFSSNQIPELKDYSIKERQAILAKARTKLTAPREVDTEYHQTVHTGSAVYLFGKIGKLSIFSIRNKQHYYLHSIDETFITKI